MDDKPCPAHIKTAITRFDHAAQDYAFKGSAHPDEWEEIELTYAQARAKLEAAYLDLHDEVKRLRAERLYIVGWNAGWDEAQYQAAHGRPSDGDITPKYEFTSAEMAAVEAERDALRAALESIANNTCCDGCQEAALVARAALKGDDND